MAAIESNAEAELQKLGRALELYATASRKTATEVLWQKGNDLRIQLFRAYSAQRWKGTRRGAAQSAGVSFIEMRRRAKSGAGVTLRAGLVASENAPETYLQRRRLVGKSGSVRRLRVPVRMSDYQRRVWTELARRQSGIGVLSVSFLLQRWRYRKGDDGKVARYLATNKTNLGLLGDVTVETYEQRNYRNSRTLGRVILGSESVRITGFTEGIAAIGNRYGLTGRAFSAVTADMVPYLQRKLGPNFAASMRANGIAA